MPSMVSDLQRCRILTRVWMFSRRPAAAASRWLSALWGPQRQSRLAGLSDHLWRDIGLAALDGMDAAERAVCLAEHSVRSRDLRWK